MRTFASRAGELRASPVSGRAPGVYQTLSPVPVGVFVVGGRPDFGEMGGMSGRGGASFVQRLELNVLAGFGETFGRPGHF